MAQVAVERCGSWAQFIWLPPRQQPCAPHMAAPKNFRWCSGAGAPTIASIHSNSITETMVISSNALAYIDVINKYLALLAAGDVRGIVSLFSPTGAQCTRPSWVCSRRASSLTC
jgi:hypothetical protein